MINQIKRKFQSSGFLIPLLLSSLWFCVSLPSMVFAGRSTKAVKPEFSGYVKSLNFFTKTSGFLPEQVDNPLLRSDEDSVFNDLDRFRIKMRLPLEIHEGQKLITKIDYDHQANFGSFVGTGDFRIARNQTEDRQFLDLSQTLVEKEAVFYEHRFYRASITYDTQWFKLELGRQQIPWGVGRFFTPTDLFNPFNPTQIELDERDGVDAVNLMTEKLPALKGQFIYTPRGRQLHPQRYLARVWRDIHGYEIGLLGGRVQRDHAVGFDFQGNWKGSGLRGEFLYREARSEKDFIKSTFNIDYNFPHNIYALAEYHFNGQGRRNERAYQLDRYIRGDIQQLAKNYTALLLGYDLTPLIRLENRTIFNLDDASLFVRPEIRYEARSNLLVTAGSQLFLGGSQDEFGRPNHLFFLEAKYSF